MTDDRRDPVAIRGAVKDAIKRKDDGDGAPIDTVVADVIELRAKPSSLFDVFAEMFRDGEVYEPRTGYVRLTTGDDDYDDVDDGEFVSRNLLTGNE